jgi:ATP-dependent Clp protease ATP-binding subunit ClpB
VRRRPYCVILLDEIEKAHPDVFNILLQILDDGRLTDSQGRTVDFKNTVIIMTSNVGSQAIIDDKLNTKQREEAVLKILRNTFKPEFLNRVDDIVIFNSLSEEDISSIVTIQLNGLARRLSERKITLKFDDKVVKLITEIGFDSVYGARPLKRAIQDKVQNALAKSLISKEIGPGDTVTVSANGPEIEIKRE